MSEAMTATNLDTNERFEGFWNGEEVKSKRVWSGHRFTDDEILKLLDGEEIEIEAFSKKNNSTYRCTGRLARLSFNGNDFVGFERTGFVNDGPTNWCGYKFTDAEKQEFLDGKEIEFHNKFVSRSGNKFSAILRWNSSVNKIEVVEFIKG